MRQHPSLMKTNRTYFDEEGDAESPAIPPSRFPEEALTDGNVLLMGSFAGADEALPPHVPLGSEQGCILGLNVEIKRKAAKLSKVRFCELVGISRPMLDKIERGESNPRLDLLKRLAFVLNVKVDELLEPPFDDVGGDFYRRSRQRSPFDNR